MRVVLVMRFALFGSCEMNVDDNKPTRSRRLELVAVVLFVVVNLLAPLVVGEMYPFTISPMFRDQPEQYCTYQLFDESGSEIAPETFGLHLVYDGNPPGLGMGIEAVSRMHEFGEVPNLDEVEMHVRNVAKSSSAEHSRIRISQSVVCCNGTCPEANVREVVVSFEPQDQACLL